MAPRIIARLAEKLGTLRAYLIAYREPWRPLAFRIGLLNECTVVLRDDTCSVRIKRRDPSTLRFVTYIAKLVARGARVNLCDASIQIEGIRLHLGSIEDVLRDLALLHHVYETFVERTYGFLDVKNRSVVDLGASIGDTALFFLQAGATKIYAYEPHPRICKLLKRNIEANNVSDAIIVKCVAVASCPAITGCKLRLCVNESWHGSSYIVKSMDGCEPPAKPIEVPVEPPGTLPDADVLKMDCEGCEYDVIESMEKPKYAEIGMELHVNRGDYVRLFTKLQSLGYRVSIVKPQGASLTELAHMEQAIIHAVLHK